MKKRRGFYIDPLWLAMLLVGIAVGLMIAALRPAKAVEVVKEVPVVQTVIKTVTEPAEPAETGVGGDLDLLALVIYQEAGGDMCSDETRQMVGEVALNRVADKRYPNTLYGVLTQLGQYGRLHWTGIQWPERAANPGEKHAVERAYRIAEELLIDKVERLLPEDVIYQAEFQQGTEIVAEADGFYFCR